MGLIVPVLGLAMASMLGILLRGTRPSVADILMDYKRGGLVAEPSAGFGGSEAFSYVLQCAVKELNSAGRALRGARINVLPPDPDYLNLYFVREREGGKLPQVLNNCAYTGDATTVVCDLGFVEWLQRPAQGLIPPDTPKYLQDEIGGTLGDVYAARRRNIVYWLVLHEIGHIACRHGPRAFQPAPSAGADAVLRTVVASEWHDLSEETEADEFMIKVLRRADAGAERPLANLCNAGLNSFIYEQLAFESERQGAVGVPARTHHLKFRMREGATHLPLLVRALKTNVLLVGSFDLEATSFTEKFLTVIDIEVTP